MDLIRLNNKKLKTWQQLALLPSIVPLTILILSIVLVIMIVALPFYALVCIIGYLSTLFIGRDKMGKCESENCHDKVYESVVLLSDPPKNRWICARCYKQGTDTLYEIRIGERRYEQILEEKRKNEQR